MAALARDKKRSALAAERVYPFLAGLASIPPGEWRHFARLLRLVTLAKGCALTRAGDVADCFGFVLDGVVKKVHVTAHGRSVVRGFSGPGELTGAYASLLSQEPSNLSVEAVATSTLLVMSWQAFVSLYDRHACWQVVGRRVAEAQLIERETRAHELLTQSPSERYAAFCERYPGLVARLRQYEIASYLGITPVSLSRLRARRARHPRAKKSRARLDPHAT
jgi:CRP-like cAMP-binding protein